MVGTTLSSSNQQQQQQTMMISSSNTSNNNTNFFRYYGSVLIVSTGIILFESIILYQLLYRRTTRHQHEQQQQQENRDSDDRTTTVDEKEHRQQQQQQQQQDEHQTESTTKCIYLDYNGTTPIYNEIYDSMKPYFLYHFGNPSSKHHSYGQQPYSAIEYARQQIRTMLLFGAAVAETTTTTTTSSSSSRNSSHSSSSSNIPSIIFTGCGTEANNLAISLAIQKYYTNTNYNHPSNDPSLKKQQQLLPHIVTTNIEHPAIEQCLLYYETNQLCTVTYVPVQSDGRVVANDVINAIRRTNNNETALVTVMYANNESGALQPVKEIAEYCYANNILMHIDAAQAVGKVSMDVITTLGNPAMVTIVGHKIGAPKGIACLYIRDGSLDDGVLVVNDDDTSNQPQQPYNTKYHGLLFGGGQESGFRPGTENVPYIVALGKACEICTMQWEANNIHMESLRTLLINELYKLIPNSYETIRIHGPSDPTQRLPNTVSIGIRNIHSGILLSTIGQFVAASAGAACHSVVASSSEEEDNNDNQATNEYSSVSSVLRAMQIPLEYAKGTIRLSIGPTTTANEIRTAAQIIATAVQDQWSVLPSSSTSTTSSNKMLKPPTSITNGTTTTTTASAAAVETIRNTIPPTPMNNVYTFPDRFELNV